MGAKPRTLRSHRPHRLQPQCRACQGALNQAMGGKGTALCQALQYWPGASCQQCEDHCFLAGVRYALCIPCHHLIGGVCVAWHRWKSPCQRQTQQFRGLAWSAQVQLQPQAMGTQMQIQVSVCDSKTRRCRCPLEPSSCGVHGISLSFGPWVACLSHL